MSTDGEHRLFLIDGMALLFRSFYAMGQANLTAPDGTPTGAVYGFLKVVSKILKEQKPTHFAVLWDTKDKTFRHDMFPAYKANRSEPPEEIIPQIGIIQKVLPELGVPCLRMPGYEADDLIGTMAEQAKNWAKVFIVSADKDFMQLLDHQVKMFSLKKGDEYIVIDDVYVEDYFGVPPKHVVDMLALIGDKVDNVPGVRGIGEKGAAKLIHEFGSLDGVYANLDKIAGKKQRESLIENQENAYLSKKLVTIDCHVPLELGQSALVYSYERLVGHPSLKTVLNDLKMHSLLRQLVGDGAGLQQVHAFAKPPNAANNGRSDDPPATLFDDTEEPSSERDGAAGQGQVAGMPDKAAWGTRNYHGVVTWSELSALLARLSAKSTVVAAFDTETTGLDFIQDKPIGFSLAFEAGEAFYVPATKEHFASKTEFADAIDDPQRVWKELGAALAARSCTLVAHNAKFDWHMVRCLGLDFGESPVACSMVGRWLLDAQSGRYGLDAQCLSNLGLEKIATSALIGGKSGRSSMREVPFDDIVEYACEDADATLRLWKVTDVALRELKLWALFWELEMPLLRVLVDMERTGVHIDCKLLADLTVEIQDALTTLEQEVFELAGENFKLSSPKQLGAILFEKLKIHEQLGFKGKLARTSLGFKTDAGVLEQFSEHPLIGKIQEYRELSKLLSTYVLVLPQLVKERTGRIHTHFHQIGTATGRLSSSDPNLQNIPVRTPLGQRVRDAFCAPDERSCIVSVDYSQIELRVLAELADDPTMIAAFLSGADIHRETAAKIAGKSAAEVTPAERSAAKAINFGIIYGMGPQRLAREQGVTLAEARTFIEKYFLNFSRIQSFIESSRAFAHRNGYVLTAFGRIRPVPQLHSRNLGEVRQAENVAINSPIQGSAADIMKLGMLGVHGALKKRGLKAKMLLQVHDELVFECPLTELEELKTTLRETLQNVVSFKVPMTVDIGVGRNWSQAK